MTLQITVAWYLPHFASRIVPRFPFSERLINTYLTNPPANQYPPMPLSECRQVNENLALTMLLGRYVEGPRMKTADPIWLIGSTFQLRESHLFSVKITFPFSQAVHVTRQGKEAGPLNARSSLSFSCLRHTRHVCPGTSRRTYVPLMKNPVTMAEGLEIPIRISGVPLRCRRRRRRRRYRIYPVRETRNFGRKISPPRAPPLPPSHPARRRKWRSGGISHEYRYERFTIDPRDRSFAISSPSSS